MGGILLAQYANYIPSQGKPCTNVSTQKLREPKKERARAVSRRLLRTRRVDRIKKTRKRSKRRLPAESLRVGGKGHLDRVTFAPLQKSIEEAWQRPDGFGERAYFGHMKNPSGLSDDKESWQRASRKGRRGD